MLWWRYLLVNSAIQIESFLSKSAVLFFLYSKLFLQLIDMKLPYNQIVDVLNVAAYGNFSAKTA